MSTHPDRKRTLEPTSAMIDDLSLRYDPAHLSSSSTSTSLSSKKRKKREDNASESKKQSNPMVFNKIRILIEIDDRTKFMEQFDTKQNLTLDQLGYIAESLIRIKASSQTQRDYWCRLIDEKIVIPMWYRNSNCRKKSLKSLSDMTKSMNILDNWMQMKITSTSSPRHRCGWMNPAAAYKIGPYKWVNRKCFDGCWCWCIRRFSND